MKKILTVALYILMMLPVWAADGDLFKYPVPPADMERLDERCDFIVSRFWRGVDLKAALSQKEKLNGVFGDWISFMPFASADTVHAAIDRLLNDNRKSAPVIAELAYMAENWTYCDTAEMFSEEIYYPFAAAAAANKKINGADRARFQQQAQIIDNSRAGQRVKHLDYVFADGTKGDFETVRSQIIVLLFNHHDCDNCTLARVRLHADINATALQKAGILTVMNIQPESPDDDWRAAVPSMPQEWLSVASPDAYQYFDIPASPTIYLLDARHKVLAKNVTLDSLLSALANIRNSSGL